MPEMVHSKLDRDTETLMGEMTRIPLVLQILDRLDRELPTHLTFHSSNHTRDVMREALRFALHDGLSQRELELLAIAAAYHDAGFLEQVDDNESIAARMVEEAMRKEGSFEQDEINLVRTMILDTKLQQTPVGLRQIASSDLSKYLLDADLSNFGRDDFFERLAARKNEINDGDSEKLLRSVLTMFDNHEWFTLAAKTLRQERKAENRAQLQTLIDEVLERGKA